MFEVIIVFIIAFFSTLIGSMTGAGGGVIMKPVMDMVTSYDALTIGILSSFTLIAMGVVNIYGHISKKTEIKLGFSISLTIGGVIGGVVGSLVLNIFSAKINDDSLIKFVQNLILVILTILSLIYVQNKHKIKGFHIKNKLAIVFIGFLLGGISTFLGIGGGPINVTILVLLFAVSAKEAAVYSIIIILFSQISKMIQITFTSGFSMYELDVAPFMMIGGVLGGYIGAKFNKKFTEKQVLFVFNAIQVFVIVTCLVNLFKNL